MHALRAGAILVRTLLLTGAAALMLSAAAAGVTVVDGGGRSVAVDDATRILSIGGDVTEISTPWGRETASSVSTPQASSRRRS